MRILGFNIQNSIVPIQTTFIEPQQVLTNSCLSRQTPTYSSFRIYGTGGLPISPTSQIMQWELLTDISDMTALQSTNTQAVDNVEQQSLQTGESKMVEAQEIAQTGDGRILLRTANSSDLVSSYRGC